MILNNSEGKIIHTQRNNKIKPYSACNVTSFINALKCCDIDFDYPHEMQPEDYFMKLMMSETAWKNLYAKYGKACGANPWNFSEILVKMCNEHLVGSPVCEIKYANINEIREHLEYGSVLTTSGSFTRSGHFVTIVGFETNDKDEIVDLIIDDPFGNYHTKYKNINGDNIKMPYKDFIKIIKPNKKSTKRTQFFYRE